MYTPYLEQSNPFSTLISSHPSTQPTLPSPTKSLKPLPLRSPLSPDALVDHSPPQAQRLLGHPTSSSSASSLAASTSARPKSSPSTRQTPWSLARSRPRRFKRRVPPPTSMSSNQLIHSAAMIMVRKLNSVVVTSNLFGDIIDRASVIPNGEE